MADGREKSAGAQLQRAAQEQQPRPVRRPLNTEPSRRVLVVDDNLVNRQVATRLIERLGYVADAAADGAAALEAMDQTSYGLVLMDCQMPVMDGYTATEEIRRREKRVGVRPTPIVALTAHALVSNRERCLQIGMDDFVTKPVTLTQLGRVLDMWLDGPEPGAA